MAAEVVSALSRLAFLLDHRVPADVADQIDDLIPEVLDEHAHELAEKIRKASYDGTGNTWNWWDAATIPGECADLIDPEVDE